MASERRIITTRDATSQRILVSPQVVTTDATPVPIYTSVAVLAELRRVYIRCAVLISKPDVSKVSSVIAEVTMARATGGALRIVDIQFSRSSGEIRPNEARVTIEISSGRFVVMANGSAGTTYEWTAMIDLLRNN